MLKKRQKFVFIIVFFSIVFAEMLFADTRGSFTIRNDSNIDVQISNLTIRETLSDLAVKIPLEIRGKPVGNEKINLNLSNVSLEAMLKQLMRGYNYVLIKPETGKTVLMVLGRAERTKYTDPPPQANIPAATTASVPSAVNLPATASMPPSGIKLPPRETGSNITTASADISGATTATVPSGQGGTSASQTDAAQKKDAKDTNVSTPPVSPTLPGREAPPVPPTLPGRDLPPMPPGLAEGKSTTPETMSETTLPKMPGETSSAERPVHTKPLGLLSMCFKTKGAKLPQYNNVILFNRMPNTILTKEVINVT